MAQKRKRCSLSVAEKRNIINYVDQNPMTKKLDIANKFGIPASTLATILKSKDKFSEESGLNVNSKRLKSCEFKDVEECVLKWLKQCRDKKIPIGGPILELNWDMKCSVLATGGFKISKNETRLFFEKYAVKVVVLMNKYVMIGKTNWQS